MTFASINFKEKLSAFSDQWAPEVIADLKEEIVLLIHGLNSIVILRNSPVI